MGAVTSRPVHWTRSFSSDSSSALRRLRLVEAQVARTTLGGHLSINMCPPAPPAPQPWNNGCLCRTELGRQTPWRPQAPDLLSHLAHKKLTLEDGIGPNWTAGGQRDGLK